MLLSPRSFEPATPARPAAPHPAAGLVSALPARLRYTWNNSRHPAWRTTRSRVDDAPSRVQAVVSRERHGLLDIAYVGLPAGRTNILQLLEHQRSMLGMDTGGREQALVAWRDLARGALPPADLVVIGAESGRLAQLPAGHGITAPFRIHLTVDVPAKLDDLERQISKRERWQFRRDHARHDWAWTEDTTPDALEFFYLRMHLPTMATRHGDRSRTEAWPVARYAVLPSGRLFFLTDAGHRVAGVLCHWSADGTTLTTRLLGVLDGDEQLYRDGTFKAVYHHLLRWAQAQGVPRVDFYGTEAFISKGIFQWKRRLGPRVELPPNHFSTKRIRLYARRDTPALRDFLVANPLLSHRPDGSLVPVYFTDGQRPPRLDLSARCPGMPAPHTLPIGSLFAGTVPTPVPVTP
ncbi:GNAT family N-acetyltransferase [Streptomyces sp. E2N166]|uniref:GNAT family N-acetyltransferase n=1 Tax=Streptomyces sp. E2N166 TaxID=1851909 RepID=UPI000EF679FE|nr:GNAT family N-acetyltransferase [Streptomyces sp. E2N166]